MPASNISRITHSFPPELSQWAREACASLAKEAAKTQVAERIRTGGLLRSNKDAINAAFHQIYYAEYYRNMNIFDQSGRAPRTDLVETSDRSGTKFFSRHTVVNFSHLNCFIHVHRQCITISRFNFPLDGDESPETKEAFVTAWPGPLDKLDNTDQMRRKVIEYINLLQQHDSLRRIKYCDSANDERRVVILNLLRELIHQNGSIDAAGITRLLLDPHKTQINNEDSNRKPIETIQKYLLLGNRAGAIKFARTKRLFDHAQCLAFLDRYQPPRTHEYAKDSLNLKDDPIVLLNDDYISTVDHPVLNTVYRSLLNRILETEPESMKIVRRPNVMNNNYEFAILSANDCEMDFDQSNEVFKLIRASKRMLIDTSESCRHLIALGFTYLERSVYDTEQIDDTSNKSHLSFNQLGDTYATRTLIISNFDLLILNEIWEYCLNLAQGTSDPDRYQYVTNLIPYKLIFASCLFDFGLHNMFAQYIESIRKSLDQARAQVPSYRYGDEFYDWATIDKSVNQLWRTWQLFQSSPGALPQYSVVSPESMPAVSNIYDPGSTQPINEFLHSSPPVEQNDVPYYNNYQSDFDVEPIQEPEPSQPQSLLYEPQQYQPSQHHSLQPQHFFQHQHTLLQQQQQHQHHQQLQHLQQSQQQQHYTNQESHLPQPFNMEPLAEQLNSLPDMSRYQRSDYPDSSQLIKEHDHKVMKSSSPVNKNRESMGDSFPFSPIQENIDPQSNDTSRRNSVVPNDISNNEPIAQQPQPQQSQPSSSGNNSKSQSSGDQQNNFLTSLMGTAKSLLPKSNSKPMILPDDTNKTIDYDSNLGKWVNRSDPNGALEDEVTDAPPKMNTAGPSQYSFKKSQTKRYPTPNFQ